MIDVEIVKEIIMRRNIETWDDFMESHGKWHKWFAWYPCRIGKQKVWLETIERRCVGIKHGFEENYPEWEYR